MPLTRGVKPVDPGVSAEEDMSRRGGDVAREAARGQRSVTIVNIKERKERKRERIKRGLKRASRKPRGLTMYALFAGSETQ